ncbi:hypothetical protein [Micromonospora mirobrigensis]|uniref:Uncharacterized protein n=1 Tax=Micromonospora mirobrigensis TaxID=262898 RepID=A0A1C4VJF3_9ACTN|nr:hypothetical protein [Micromonospora mirobrigensis]SCE84132.1 hypothetical protein GA0070564_1011255 [Micromonospora mirobrigensis]
MIVLAAPEARPAGRVAVATLARAEARLVLRSPLLWGGLLLSVGLGTAWGWTRMPTWETFAQNAGMSSLVLAGALLLAGQLAASRDRRAGAESIETVPTTRVRRGFALLALVVVAGGAGAVLCLAELLLLLPAWPVGRFDPWTLLVTMVVPAIGAAIGVAVGRRLPATAAGPLALVGAAVVLASLPVFSTGTDSLVWQLFPVPTAPWETGAARPTGWHLSYLLAVLVAIVAMLGWGHRRVVTAGVVAVAVVAAVVATDQQLRAVPAVIDKSMEDALTGPAVLDCEMHGGVRYCALPHYTGWVPLWRDAVEPVSRNLPAAARRPAVRQFGDAQWGDPLVVGEPEIVTGTVWGRHGRWAEDSRDRMTVAYVTAVTGLLQRRLPTAAPGGSACTGAGQHRTVVALWLLAQATPDGRRRLADGRLDLGRVQHGRADEQAASALLERPHDEVATFLAAHWTQLMDPNAMALAPLGVTTRPPRVPPTDAPPASGVTNRPESCR